jgi:hypothetical protein
MTTRVAFLMRKVCAGLILLPALSVSAGAQVRIVAVGDVHGAYADFVGILQRTSLIDSNLQWIGGTSVLVQTGDAVDRGPDTRKCLDLLMELERQAKKQNGRVVVLLGNHEVMTIVGDLRYVELEDYAGFATDQSEKVREQAYQEYRDFLSAHLNHRNAALPEDEAARRKWMAEHPLGYFERRDAFGPEGVYGRWIRQHEAIAQVGDVLFMHGGLNPALPFRDIKELNERIRSELANFDSLWQMLCSRKIVWRYMKLEEYMRQMQDEWTSIQLRGQVEDPEAVWAMQKLLGLPSWTIFSPDSPIWYRGLALQPEENLKAGVEAMLRRLKARYIVAGHTVRPKFDINARFDSRVFLIDTGMLKKHYGGRASALEIQNGRFTAYYADAGPQVLSVSEGGGTAPAPKPGEADKKQKP